jgi:anthranilate synthase
MRGTFGELQRRGLPAFGVCLGLQGMVEFCGGRLARLETPAHGKQSSITCSEAPLFAGLPLELRVGRYHSLHAEPSTLPRELETLATTRDGCIMAVAHRQRPWWAVQFHPESILSADQDHGLRLIRNLVGLVSA